MPEKEKSVVSIVQGKDINKMVRDAVNMLEKKFVKKGDVVLLKPNIVSAQHWPITTNPEILRALIEMSFEAGAAKVLVGDNPAIGIGTTSRKVLRESGIEQVVLEAGAEPIYFDEEESKIIDVPEGVVFHKVEVPARILDCNVIINVPVVKTHLMTTFTGAIKNWHGVLYDHQKEIHHRSDINQKLVDLHTVVKPDLIVFDGLIAMEGQGPCWGKPVPMDIIMASADTVASDAVACAIMDIEPFEVPTTYLAHQRGIGEGRLDHIKIVGKQIAEVKRHFEMPTCELANVIEGFEVFEGGACLPGCKGNLRVCFDAIKGTPDVLKRILETKKKIGFVIGRTPSIPELEKLDHDIIFIFGDCAFQSTEALRTFTQKYRKGGKKVVVVDHGCPPVGWVTTYGKVLEQFGIPFEELY